MRKTDCSNFQFKKSTALVLTLSLIASACGGSGGGTSSDQASSSQTVSQKAGVNLSFSSSFSTFSTGSDTSAQSKANQNSEIEKVLIYPIAIRYVVESNSQYFKSDFPLISSEVDLASLSQAGMPLDFIGAISTGTLKVHQIRLFLDDNQNKIVFRDGRTCSLTVPSENQSGLKLLLPNNVILSPNHSFNINIEFDVDHSIVITGNGDCKLKPVIKVKSITESPVEPNDDENSTPTTTLPVASTTTTSSTTTTTSMTTTTTLPGGDNTIPPDDNTIPSTPTCTGEWIYDGDLVICI